MGSNPDQFIDIYSAKFDAKEDQIKELLLNTNGSLTGNKRTKITSTYDIPVSDSTDFFEAYTTALHNAFIDFIVKNHELIQILDETFNEAVEEYTR